MTFSISSLKKQLEASKELFNTVYNNSTLAILVTDQEEQIIAWNAFAQNLLKMDKLILFNKPLSDLFSSSDWQKLKQRERTSHKDSLLDQDVNLVRAPDDLIPVRVSLTRILDDEGHKSGLIAVVYDLTQEKQSRDMLLRAKLAAEEANSAKSMFLANMSHEVRTPMSTIIGMIDLTLDTELSDDQRENLTTVKNAADILLNLLNDILDLSRVEAGKVQLESIALNIRNVVQSVCKGLSVLAQKKNLELSWDVDPQVSDHLLGDPVRVRQILVNLINNAIKFTFRGKIETRVKLQEEKDGQQTLLFSVSDEGVGIAKDKLAAIFEVFTQADVSTTRRFGGTGLGLSISKRLVEMMHGNIWVESEEFKGSTFYFTARFFELAESPSSASSAPAEPRVPVAKLQKVSGNRLSILLAEDNVVNQKIVAKILEKQGWGVKTAENGKQVLEYLDVGRFDLILMDAQMPVLDGLEATIKIREKEKATGGHIPIIALTARAMTGDRQKCIDAGMDDYVTKPIDRQKLFEVIENSLQQQGKETA